MHGTLDVMTLEVVLLDDNDDVVRYRESVPDRSPQHVVSVLRSLATQIERDNT
jgi:hypothetical protein